MIKYLTSALIAVILFSSLCIGDVFKHRQSGEVFYGYPTNRSRGQKTQVYVETDGKFRGKTVLIDEYDITYDAKGRRKNLIVVGIDNPDILISDTVSKTLAMLIEEGANKGPRCIILEIDSPGGRGECMKRVCDAIRKTNNCPVIAFITGKKYGGAFSAAAGIALACDKIYIAPDAQIGTLATPIETIKLQQSVTDWHETFTPKNIGAFSEYLSTFAEKNNRPAAMVMAMIDQNIEVAEIVIDKHGSLDFVHKGNKKPAEAIEKIWSKTIRKAATRTDPKNDDNTPQNSYSITLSAKEAVYARMADAIVSSRSEVIEDLKAEDAKVIVTNRIKLKAKRFALNKFQIQKYYAAMKELEVLVEDIEKQMKEVSSAALKNKPSNDRLRRLERNDYQNRIKLDMRYKSSTRRKGNRRRFNGNLTENEIANLERRMNNTYVDPYLLLQQRLALELADVLDELLIYYSRAAGIARAYPGAVPKGKTIKQIQIKYNTAVAKLNSMGL